MSEHLFTQKQLLISKTKMSLASADVLGGRAGPGQALSFQSMMSSLHLRCLFPVPCAGAKTSLKFPVNLTDPNLLLFPRKNRFSTLQMENV